MIEVLLAKGYAYIGGNGDVFYAVEKFKDYGNLSGKKLEDLQAGERVDVDAAKQNPFDFVLWKMAKANEPSWPSPWGDGRPGWHIECSAMSTCCLGNHFDIHGGGMDLQFPHHENEIAQSEGATGEKFVNLWMHNGFVRVNEEKMSKSLGNFFTVREVLKQYRPEIIRFFILSSHYRSPLNYSDEQLNEAGAALNRLYTALRGVTVPDLPILAEYQSRFEQAMDDDFNTPVAVAVLFDLARELNKAKSGDIERVGQLAVSLKQLGSLLGILQDDPDEFFRRDVTIALTGLSMSVKTGKLNAYMTNPLASISTEHTEKLNVDDVLEYINQQIQARLDAKKAKNWALADQIRNELNQLGVILEDKPDGTTSIRFKSNS
jgi:cysteinyl-tRNA synthetase